MTPALPMTWPPLITDAKVPRYMFWRDALVTISAWLFLFWLTRHGLQLIIDEMRALFGYARQGPEAEWKIWWERLRSYAAVVGILATWLVIWGRVARRRIRRYRSMPLLVPLSLAEEAALANCSEADLAAWRDLKSVVVHFDAAGQMVVAGGGDLTIGR
jgi:poly-beta-1,6-N-acetyl-D-glucosamine biosynthesis protein PgaD